MKAMPIDEARQPLARGGEGMRQFVDSFAPDESQRVDQRASSERKPAKVPTKVEYCRETRKRARSAVSPVNKAKARE